MSEAVPSLAKAMSMASLLCQLGPREGQPPGGPASRIRLVVGLSSSYSPARPGPLRERVRRLRAPVCAAALPGPPPGPAPRPRQPPGQRNFPLDSAGSRRGRPGRVPAPSRKLAPPSPQRGATAAEATASGPPAHRVPGRPGRGQVVTHRRVWTGPALSRCHRRAPALQSEPGALLPRPRYLLGGPGSASKLRGIWLKIQAPCARLRLGCGLCALRPPSSQPATNGISSFSLHYYVRWES